MKIRTFTCLFAFILLLFAWSETSAQKVGLVLSGGGSRGVAHIGVIKALEENNIPIDYIAGTSMGAIVGGLYASGYSAADIENMMTSGEINDWASGKINDEYLYMYREGHPDASWVRVPFVFNEGLKSRLPTNLISPYSMDFAFLEFFSGPSAAAGYDFDSLFIPFRCVASDIDSNRAVILKRGQLSKAVRASMTYPFYFKPIKVNSMLMFDGGMYNNFPVDVMREDFQPDIIIGSKAAGNYDSPLQDDIVSQIQNMLMTNTNYTIDSSWGVVIEPKLSKVNVIDFSRTRSFVDSGYVATLQKLPRIKKLIERREDEKLLAAKRHEFVMSQPPLIIDTIMINGLKSNQSKYVRKKLKNKRKYITINELKEEYFKLVTDENIEFVYPELSYDPETGFYGLNLGVEKASPFMASFGGNISSSAVNEAFIGLQYRNLGANAKTIAANAYFGRFYSSAKLATRIDFPGRNPFYSELRFVYNHKDYFKNSTYFFEDKQPSFLIENDNHLTAEAGLQLREAGRFTAGFSLGYLKEEYYQVNTFSRVDTADRTYFDLLTPYISYELNSLNRKQFASSGARFFLSFRYVAGEEESIPGSTSVVKEKTTDDHEFFQIRLIYDNYFESIGKVKLGFYGEAIVSNQGFFSNYTSSILMAPAFRPIPESKTLFLPNYRAHDFAAAGLKLVYPVARNLDLRAEAYLMQPYQQIEQNFEDRKARYGALLSDRSFIGSGVLVYHSPLGPLSLSLNYYDRTRDSFSFFINFGYLLFNKSILD